MKLPRGVSPKKHLSLRLPTPLFAALTAEEERTGETRNQIIERLLIKGLKMSESQKYVVTSQHGDRKIIAENLKVALSLAGWSDHRCVSDQAALEELSNDPAMAKKGIWIETLESHLADLKNLLAEAEDEDEDDRERLTNLYTREISRWSAYL